MKNKLPYESTSTAIQGYSESKIAKSENADCVVRAFASAFDISYDRAHKYVAEKFNRQPKRGTYGTVSRLVQMADNRTTVNYKKVYPVGVRKSSTLINSLSASNKDLLELSEKKKRIEKAENKIDNNNVTNNLFIGSTAELQKLLKGE